MLGRLCHGRERKPLEPYGVVAPLVRTVAWALVCLGSLSLLLGIVVSVVSVVALHRGPATVLFAVAGWTVATGLVGLLVAAMWRPSPVPLTAWDLERDV